ncbi:hypothetical protein DY000_02023245 [Brassica cretica]|uniref:Uncharacterized protein n=1 Tax=Brassica cretica TaxID=69181 RepID=A0ABQ7EM54_BRACR|nr:hypothetical protein DY000_02023245 [Brassica cretica]
MSSLSFVVSTRTGNELGANRPKTVKLSDEITLTFIFSSHLLETHGEWFSLETTRFPGLCWCPSGRGDHDLAKPRRDKGEKSLNRERPCCVLCTVCGLHDTW